MGSVREWQPIGTAPQDGTTVDLWVSGDRAPDCFWATDEWLGEPHWRQRYAESWNSSYQVDGEITHWMPRPDAPGSGK